jgi:D-tyrosyl-tRNA(Tyr) deacylase
MKAVVQRVSRAEVVVGGQSVGRIGEGILALVAISRNDTEKDLLWMARKIVELRIFDDSEGKLNLSLQDVKGQLLVVSQFTLYGDCRKGRRPSYIEAAPPAEAEKLYQQFVSIMRQFVPDVQTGQFQAMMEVTLTNSGPVTLILEN